MVPTGDLGDRHQHLLQNLAGCRLVREYLAVLNLPSPIGRGPITSLVQTDTRSPTADNRTYRYLRYGRFHQTRGPGALGDNTCAVCRTLHSSFRKRKRTRLRINEYQSCSQPHPASLHPSLLALRCFQLADRDMITVLVQLAQARSTRLRGIVKRSRACCTSSAELWLARKRRTQYVASAPDMQCTCLHLSSIGCRAYGWAAGLLFLGCVPRSTSTSISTWGVECIAHATMQT